MRSTVLPFLALTACQPGVEAERAATFDAIAPGDTVSFAGTEPFWGGTVKDGQLTYRTPENADGVTIPIDRFAGNSGLGLSGALGERSLDLTITRGTCADRMSDRTYPYTATLALDGEVQAGCAWTDREPYDAP